MVGWFGGLITKHAKREFGLHLVLAELCRLERVHAEVGGAGGEDLEERVALVVALDLEQAFDRQLALHDALRVGHRDARDVDRCLQLVEHLAHVERMSRERGIAPERRGGGLLALQRGGGHLAAGHAVEGVVDEDAAELFAARSGLEGVVEADRAEVAVALVGDRDGVGAGAAHACGGGRGASVRGGDVSGVPIVVGEHAAADRINEYRLVLQTHLGANLCDTLVSYAVPAPRTIMRCPRMRLAAARELPVHPFLFYHHVYSALKISGVLYHKKQRNHK